MAVVLQPWQTSVSNPGEVPFYSGTWAHDYAKHLFVVARFDLANPHEAGRLRRGDETNLHAMTSGRQLLGHPLPPPDQPFRMGRRPERSRLDPLVVEDLAVQRCLEIVGHVIAWGIEQPRLDAHRS